MCTLSRIYTFRSVILVVREQTVILSVNRRLQIICFNGDFLLLDFKKCTPKQKAVLLLFYFIFFNKLVLLLLVL